MQEEWREIREFPGYSVSESGSVRNDLADRTMAKLVNQHGIVHVGLSKNGIQYKRSLTLLVAQAFIERPRKEFDTPINLDGDRYNNNVLNLMWRPRWFATRYYRQFDYDRATIDKSIELIETEEVFPSSWTAATSLGFLNTEVIRSIMRRSYVFPTFQHFRILQ